MRKFMGLTKRNILVFFKDKTMVLFSMLTPIIIFLLYLLFLRGTYLDSLERSSEVLLGMGLLTKEDLGALANGLLLTGILGSALITIPYNCLTTLVNDRDKGVDVDITATPVSRLQIILSYYTASALSAILMSSVILCAGLIILQLGHPVYLSAKSMILLFATVMVGAISATAVFMIIVLFIKSSSASGAFLAILSAASGFLIGAYIPISGFSDRIETFCNLFPATGITVLIRRFLLTDLLTHMDKGIGGVDGGQFTAAVKTNFSFESTLFSQALSWKETYLYVIIVTAVFLGAIGLIYPMVYRKK